MTKNKNYIFVDKNVNLNNDINSFMEQSERIIQNKKSTIETTERHRIIREIGGTRNNAIVKLIQKNYSTNTSKKKNKNLQKLNFDQPNKNIANQKQ